MISLASIRLRNGLWLLLLWCFSCVEPYSPELSDVSVNSLVVDGFINTRGATTIKLSRTQPVQEEQAVALEKGASVFVEEKDGARFALAEREAGTYQGANGVINPQKLYRLYIKTAAGKEYASEFVPVQITPAIDAVTWKVEQDGVQIYVSAHDDQRNTRYYRWEFEETWQFNSAFDSKMLYQGGELQYRKDNIYTCWRSEFPGTITTASTIKLNQDIIHEAALVKLPASSEKLKYKYSILVRQFAQTKESFAYWEMLKKNTQEIGSLYDPLPSKLTGNIRSLSDPAEQVIGFVGASSVEEKRIFIDRAELPARWVFDDEYKKCRGGINVVFFVDLEMTVGQDSESSGLRLVNPVYGQFSELVGATYDKAECVDCRFRGTNIKPSFWQ